MIPLNDLESFKNQFASAKSSVEISGFIITPEMEDLIFREATGTITFEEFIREAKLLVKKAGENSEGV